MVVRFLHVGGAEQRGVQIETAELRRLGRDPALLGVHLARQGAPGFVRLVPTAQAQLAGVKVGQRAQPAGHGYRHGPGKHQRARRGPVPAPGLYQREGMPRGTPAGLGCRRRRFVPQLQHHGRGQGIGRDGHRDQARRAQHLPALRGDGLPLGDAQQRPGGEGIFPQVVAGTLPRVVPHPGPAVGVYHLLAGPAPIAVAVKIDAKVEVRAQATPRVAHDAQRLAGRIRDDGARGHLDGLEVGIDGGITVAVVDPYPVAKAAAAGQVAHPAVAHRVDDGAGRGRQNGFAQGLPAKIGAAMAIVPALADARR